jgi:8-oxo-dGTP diphosphatase
VLEETGHNVTVREFLGTLVYESSGRAKVVHYWSMEANGEPARALMSDIRAVDWLPLNAAVQRLSRDHERVFLETVGPLAISAQARRLRAKAAAKEPAVAAPMARKDRAAVVAPEAVPIAPLSSEPLPQLMPPLEQERVERTVASTETPAIEPLIESDAARMGVEPGGETDTTDTTDPADNRRRSFAQKLRGWLRRAS